MADKKAPDSFSGAVVALARGGPIGGKMRREGDVFMVDKGEFSKNWMRKATKDEKDSMKPDEPTRKSLDDGTVDRLTGELKAMTKERDDALGQLAECQNELEEMKSAEPEVATSTEPPKSLMGKGEPKGTGTTK